MGAADHRTIADPQGAMIVIMVAVGVAIVALVIVVLATVALAIEALTEVEVEEGTTGIDGGNYDKILKDFIPCARIRFTCTYILTFYANVAILDHDNNVPFC